TNTATLSGLNQVDSDSSNNSDSATVTPQQADLAVTKTVSNSAPNVGDTTTFTVTLNDLGPNTAINVTVQDALPAGRTFITATPSQGTYSGGVWTVGTVAVGTPQTLQIVARVVSTGAQTNTATISHADQFDPNTANNSASTTVRALPVSPALSTTPTPTTITLGATTPPILTDTATLSGGFQPTGTITFTLLFNGGGTPVDTETVTVNGNGNYTTPAGFTLPTSGTVTGTYQWIATYSGDTNNNPASDGNPVSERVTV